MLLNQKVKSFTKMSSEKYPPNTVDPLNHENSHSMISKADDSFSKEKEQPLLDGNNGVTRLPAAKETFMTPFTGFSTIINIVLATGPFTYF